MVQDWLLEFGIGAAKLLLHPVLYVSLLLAAWLGVSRVKRERRQFHVRAENAYFELRQLVPLGLILGIVLSALLFAAGVVIPIAAVILTAIVTILLSINTRLLSPVYTVGLSFFLVLFLAGKEWSVPLPTEWISALPAKLFPSIAVLLALLVMAEGLLIAKNGPKGTSPDVMLSKRGQRVGIHQLKRLWIVPMFLLVPGNSLGLPFDWWPLFSIGGQEVSVLLVPFMIGHVQHVQAFLPKQAIQTVGKQILWHGLFVLLLAIGSYWLPVLAIAAVAIAIFGRELIAFNQRLKEENRPFYFAKRNQGVMILGIIPDSPAQKMNLGVGEIITKVNGVPVQNERAIYEALQKNRAHCKLEVLDVNNEVRFVSRALYEGDHHELGILFVQDEKKWGTEAV